MRHNLPKPERIRWTGADLQKWLIEHNWTNAEGANRLGVSVRSLYNWLDGREPRDLYERAQAVDNGETPTRAAPKPQYWIMLPAKGTGKHEMRGQKTDMTPDEIRTWKLERGIPWDDMFDGELAE